LKLFAAPVGSRHRLAYLAGAVALILSFLLAIGTRAEADQVYWVNHESIGYSALDDSAGGFLPDSVNAIHEGMGAAIDTANGRIYVALRGTNQIAWFGLDGVSAGIVSTAVGTVEKPTNVVIDPETQTLYWANDTNPGSIAWSTVSGSAGGILASPGSTTATVDKPSRIAIDTNHHRIYWWNEGAKEFSWVTNDKLVGGNLSTPGLEPTMSEAISGIAIEPYSTPEELYFGDNELKGVFHTDPLLGGAPEEVQNAWAKTGKENALDPTGLAFDVTGFKFYWANTTIIEEPKEAIGTATIFGHPGLIPVFPVAPIHNPVFATILKAPNVLEKPQVTESGYTLSCTLGVWEGDHPGASVFAAPTTYAYEWRKSGTPEPVGNESSFTATETGSYSCVVSAENAAGVTTTSSSSTTLTFPAKPKPPATTTTTTTTSTSKTKAATPAPTPAAVGVKLASTKPTKVKAGGTAVIDVDLANTGGTTSGSTKVCAGKLTKQAKKGLKAPACVTVKSVAAGKTAVAKLSVKTLASAKGTYKLTLAASGAASGSMTAKVQIAAAKRKK
jgi:hypothetical protein